MKVVHTVIHDIRQRCWKKVRWLEDLKKQPKSTTSATCEVRIMGTDEEPTGGLVNGAMSMPAMFHGFERVGLSESFRPTSCAFYRFE